MMDAAVQHFGRIDILVNNAGVTHLPQPLEDVSEADFDRIVAVNMKAIYLAMREVGAAHEGASGGPAGHPWRGAEHGQHGRREPAAAPGLVQRQQGLGDHRHAGQCGRTGAAGIRVVALNPVAGETPLLKSFMGQDTPEMRARFLSTIPIGRFSTPEDLGNAACFLCSDEASMITGVCMEVDGGRCI
jgi:3-oxoacyl-[acyl-carrier protein] reductase